MPSLLDAADRPLRGGTPREVATSYDGSIVFRRWLGAFIDLMVFVGLLIARITLAGELRNPEFYFWIAGYHLYFVMLEAFGGVTIGKLVARVRVLGADGRRPGLWKAILRTLTRPLELNPILFGGLPAGFVAFQLSPTHQRIGDMLAGTYVIKTEDLSGISAI
jgi:uncharacterized RDD family membrane protein YckC